MLHPPPKLRWLTFVVVFLLLQLVLRVHHLTLQGAYVDEGFHSMLGAVTWKLDTLPDRLQDGRVLLYYYLGLFEVDSTTALFTSRTAIALFSLISGAVVYALGRSLHSRAAGILALALYCIMPFTFFHERMALADPFAASFACLVTWRSFVFAHHPRWRDGVILGVLLALSAMAKLTIGLLPLLPVLASIIYFPQLSDISGHTLKQRVQWWLRHYFPPLALAAVIMIVLWLPILMLAYQSRGTPHQFSLVASMAVAVGSNGSDPLAYMRAVLRDTLAYTSSAFYIGVILAILYFVFKPKLFQPAFFLIFWLAIVSLFTFGFAAIVAPRYILPAAAPVILLIAVVVADLWDRATSRMLIRAALLTAGGLWLVVFALPFIATALSRPEQLPLPAADYSYYLGGTFAADDTTIQTAHSLDNADPLIRIDPAVKVVYGDWVICRLIYFYMHRPVTCLLEPIYKQQLATFTNTDLAPGEAAYLVMLDAGPDPAGVAGICSKPFVRYIRAHLFSIVIWRLQRLPCDTKSF